MSKLNFIEVKEFLIHSGQAELVSWQRSKALCRMWAKLNTSGQELASANKFWNNELDRPAEIYESYDILFLFFFCLTAWEKGHGVFDFNHFKDVLYLSHDDRVLLAKKEEISILEQSDLDEFFEDWKLRVTSFLNNPENPLKGIRFVTDFSSLKGDGDLTELLVVQGGNRFTLPKLYQDQYDIVEGVKTLMEPKAALDSQRLESCVQAVLSARQEVIAENREPHYRQTLAAIMACYQDFMVITGGPGTGKTTVAKLVLWAIKNREGLEPEDITLAAPTGRARGRLEESLSSDLLSSEQSDFFKRIEARTLHSLLGIGFRREAKEINAKIVLVDECSMMDIRMFATLLQSLRPGTKLILLGDKDQLPSVAAGQILADLTSPFVVETPEGVQTTTLSEDVLSCISKTWKSFEIEKEKYTQDFSLQNNVVFLTKTFRSSEGILNWWKEGSSSSEKIKDDCLDFYMNTWDSKVKERRMKIQEYVRYFSPAKKFEKLKIVSGSSYTVDFSITQKENLKSKIDDLNTSFRILCAHNTGPAGVEWFNSECLKAYTSSDKDLSLGVPIMIKRNQKIGSYSISNGDVGFIGLVYNGNRQEYRFLLPFGNEVLAFSPSQIVDWDYAFAISIHKSQGSEFNKVVVATTRSAESALWTRQLIYTGITRAKTELEILNLDSGLRVPKKNGLRGSLIGF